MKADETKLLASLDEFIEEHGLEVELNIMKRMLRAGDPVEKVSFMMRGRYSTEMVTALRNQLVEEGELVGQR